MDAPIQPSRGITADALEGAVWRKSSFSGTQGNCVEVAMNLPGLVAVRDSKNPDGTKLVVGAEQWLRFVRDLSTT
jgi:hypothetical protein